MTRLVQISDLHFGREDADLLEPLASAIRDAAPDLVIMAGDFVQRARNDQFRKAAAYMASLELPWLGVPGNHDIPLFNLFLRFLSPYRTYKRWISADLSPRLALKDVEVLGLVTTDPLAHQRGRVTEREIRRIGRAISGAENRLPVIAAHHPFHHAPDIEKKLMVGAPDALEHWADCGPHVILSGHLHKWRFEPFIRRKGANMTLQLHCGTGLSERRRGDPNDFAILDCTPNVVSVTRMVAENRRFRSVLSIAYEPTPDGWMEHNGMRTGRLGRDAT